MINYYLGREIPEGDIEDFSEFNEEDYMEMRKLYELNSIKCVSYVRHRMGLNCRLIIAMEFVDQVIGGGVKVSDFIADQRA